MKGKYKQPLPKALQNSLDNETITDEVKLIGDKYRFYYTKSGKFKCDRYGKPLRDLTGDKAVYVLFYRILEQDEIIDNLRKIIKKKILKL